MWIRDINISTISPIIQRHSTHTKSHCPFSPLLANRSRRYSSLIFFNLVTPSRITTHVTRSNISYSLIESQPLPCAPACSHEFHALTFHPHTTFVTPLVGSTFRIQLEVCVELFCGNSERVWAVDSFRRGALSFMFGNCLTRFSPLGLHKGSLNSSCP